MNSHVDTAIHVFNPSRGALQSICGHDIVRKESVNYSNDLGGRDILREELGMALKREIKPRIIQ